MYFECERCRLAVQGEGPPFCCPRCGGTAAVVFCSLDERPQATAVPRSTPGAAMKAEHAHPTHSAWTDPETYVVLLAEPDEPLRERLAAELRREGYVVREVEDWLELEDYLAAASSPETNVPAPSVIVTATEMPGMTGIDGLCALKERYPLLPFILIDSSGDADTYEQAEELGADFVLQAPLDLDELCSVVHMAI